MHNTREHVISLVLTNEEWKAFVTVQPEPVLWLKERIQERIAAARSDVAAEKAEPASIVSIV